MYTSALQRRSRSDLAIPIPINSNPHTYLLHKATVKESSQKSPIRPILPFGWVLAVSLLCGSLALLLGFEGSSESLWVDELHSSWATSGSWSEIGHRAAAGNQLPGYFAILYGSQQIASTVGLFLPWRLDTPELALRLPSILAWSLTLGCVAAILLCSPWQLSRPNRAAGRQTHRAWLGSSAVVIGWCLCILVDRMQGFYGSEARVYALVQLCSLLGWLTVSLAFKECSLEQLDRSGRQLDSCGKSTNYRWLWFAWTLLAVGQLNLHVTSGTSILVQWMLLAALAIVQPRHRPGLLLATVTLLIAGWLIIDDLSPVWQRRSQWQSIGGDASLISLLTIFPTLPVLTPVAIAWLSVGLLAVVRSTRQAFQGTERKVPDRAQWDMPTNREHRRPRYSRGSRFLIRFGSSQWLWALAMAAPLITAWLLTRLEVAPLFHYRFLITAALPLYLFAGIQIANLPSRWLQWTAVLGSLVWLLVSQGTVKQWQHGQLSGVLRGEGWREAASYIQQRFNPASDAIWCYSGLIEGHRAEPPLDLDNLEYLSYPLRGCYQISVEGTPAYPLALVGQHRFWAQQILADENRLEYSAPQETSPTPGAPVSAAWIVCRGSGLALETRLQQSELDGLPQLHPIVEFGKVSVVCLQTGPPSR